MVWQSGNIIFSAHDFGELYSPSLTAQLNWQNPTTIFPKLNENKKKFVHSFVFSDVNNIDLFSRSFFASNETLIFIFETKIILVLKEEEEKKNASEIRLNNRRCQRSRMKIRRAKRERKGVRNRTDLNVKSDMSLVHCVLIRFFVIPCKQLVLVLFIQISWIFFFFFFFIFFDCLLRKRLQKKGYNSIERMA